MMAAARLYATDGSNYRQVPIGVVIPNPSMMSLQRLPPAAGTARRYFPAAGAPVLQANAATLPSHGYVQVSQSHSRAGPGEKNRTR